MALKKELEILVSDFTGGEEWLKVLAIDFEREIAAIEDAYDEEITFDLRDESVHDIRFTEV